MTKKFIAKIEALKRLEHETVPASQRHAYRKGHDNGYNLGISDAVRMIKSEFAPKNKAAVALGKVGGRVRASKLSSEKRKKIAQKAAITRWKVSNRVKKGRYERT